MSRQLVCALAVLSCPLPALAQDPSKGPKVPVGFEGRVLTGDARERLLKHSGGTAASEEAVANGLRWLALHQGPGGSWSLDNFHRHARKRLDDNQFTPEQFAGPGMKNDTAGTAFGLLPFLASGYTHRATRKDLVVYKKTVQAGLNFLLSQQQANGGFSGGMYAHGLATIAVCEAYALTGDPALRARAQRAIDYIINAQDPAGGGWRYQPRQSGDTSVTGWQLAALQAGKLAGLRVPANTWKGTAKFLDSVKGADGGYGYTGPNSTPAPTAIGMLGRVQLGAAAGDANLARGAQLLDRWAATADRNLYFAYYATQAAFHLGDDTWKAWYPGVQGKKGLRDRLVAAQDRDGSWDPKNDAHGPQGGRIMQTSLALLCLQAPYRYAPGYKKLELKGE